MAGSIPTKVFISYAHADGARLAQHLVRDLAADGFEPWLDNQRLYGGATWTSEIENALDRADVVVALLTRGSYKSEICRAEQVRALRRGKCVIPVIAEDHAEIPLHLELRQHLSFTSPTAYRSQFQALLASIAAQEGVALKERYRSTYVTAPPLPVNFVERPSDLADLRNAVIADGGGQHVALTALHGMGGIGKTILAQALCADDVVQQAFPDGILWVTIGRESGEDLVTRMREIGKGLNDDLGRYDTAQGSIHQYRTILRRKAALIVLDDVWNARDVEPFRADSSRSRLLFTTRDASIAATVGAREFTANLLTEEQSRVFLAQWSGRDVSDLPVEAADLIRECGRLPLALSMVGATLRGKGPAYWKGVLDLLRRADLARIRAQFPNYAHPNLFRAIQISVAELEPIMRERYTALAVLLEDMTAELPVLRTLWNVSEFEALETAEHFVSRSLATGSGDSGAIALHDLQLDYVRAQSPLRESLPLIQGALRLSAHVIARDAFQFASQMQGRLLAHQNHRAIGDFVTFLTEAAPRPWFRSIHPVLAAPGGALIRTLAGHSDYVLGVALSADGRRAVSASGDNVLKVWDVESGRELRTLTGHSDPVYGVGLSADGRRAVSASGDTTLKVWDLESGRELCTLTGHSYWVHGVGLSTDGRRAVSASGDNTLKVWDVESGRELRTLGGHSAEVYAVALSADGRCAVSASRDKTLKVWDVESGRELRTLGGHSAEVYAVALSADGRRAVSASGDNTLKVWDVESGAELCTLAGHSYWVYAVALSADGRRAVSASGDKTLKFWNVESGRELCTLAGHSATVNGVALSADGRRAVSASGDNTLKVWEVESGAELRTVADHSEYVNGVALSADGRRAVSASGDNTLKVWDVESGRELRMLASHSEYVNGVALSADGRRAVSGSGHKALKVWDVESGRELRTLMSHSDVVHGVALSADGRRAVSASAGKTLKVWDVESGRKLRKLAGHSDYVNGVALSANGRRAVSASADNTLKVWDVESGRELRMLAGHSDYVNGVALSADGRRAVSACTDNTLKVWDVESGRELRTLAGHSAAVNGVALSADGRRAVSASRDNTLKIWDMESAEAVATFTCDAPALCCAMVHSTQIVAGDGYGRVYFLTLEL